MANKILGGIFCLLFIFSAALQFNDPDPWLWIFLYGVAAIASILFALGKLRKWWAIFLCIDFIVLAIFHWPSEFEGVALQEGMKTLNIELARESLGMGISAIAMFIYALLVHKKKT